MNKKDLINYVAESAECTKVAAKTVIDAVLEGLFDGIVTDRKVTLVGFGTFTAVNRNARKARNPKTGESIDVPAKVVAKFKPSKALKDACADLELAAPKVKESELDEAVAE